jgi:hypothetical protein
MLVAIVMAVESVQNCPKLPKFTKICPKTISLRNFEIPSKIEILIFTYRRQQCMFHLDCQYNNLFILFFDTNERNLHCKIPKYNQPRRSRLGETPRDQNKNGHADQTEQKREKRKNKQEAKSDQETRPAHPEGGPGSNQPQKA